MNFEFHARIYVHEMRYICKRFKAAHMPERPGPAGGDLGRSAEAVQGGVGGFYQGANSVYWEEEWGEGTMDG